MKAWESKNAKNAAKAGGVSLMALSLAACGGSSTPVADAPAADPVVPVVPVAPAAQAFALTATTNVFTGGDGADTFAATHLTFNATDELAGGAGTDTLTIVDTGSADLTLAAAKVGGIEVINITNQTGNTVSAGSTEVASITVGAMKAGQTISIGDKTYIAAADQTAAEVATALIEGTTYDPTGYTLAQTASDTITATATTVGNKTDIAVGGNVFNDMSQKNILTVTKAADNGTDAQIWTFTVNGQTVTTASFAVDATAATQAGAIATALNAHQGSIVAHAVGATVQVISDSVLSMSGFSASAAGTGSTTPGAVANASAGSKYTLEDGTAAASGKTIKFTMDGVQYETAVTTAASDAATGAAIANKINDVYGATIATVVGDDVVVDTKGVSVALGGFVQGTGTTYVAGTLNLNTVGQGLNSTDAPVVSYSNGSAAVTAATFDTTVDASKFTGSTEMASVNSTGDVVFSNMVSTQSGTVAGNTAITNGNTTFGHKATAASAAIAIEDGTTAGNITLTGAGITSAAITSTGEKNTVGAIDLAAAKTVTLDASTNLTATSIATTATEGTLTISGAGAVSLGTLDAGFDTVSAAGNSGGLTAAIGGATDTVLTGSSGNDKITASTADTIGAAEKLAVAAGAGTDTLVIGDANDVNSAADGARYTGFEALEVSATQDMSLIAGIESVAITGDSITLSNMTATQAANVSAKASFDALTMTLATATGTTDSASIVTASATATTNVDVTDLSVDNFETVSVAFNTGTAGTQSAFDFAANAADEMTKLNITGSADVKLTVDANVMDVAAVTIDASALTGKFEIADNSGTLKSGSKVIATAQNDTIAVDDTTGTTYEGGAGKDAFTTAAATISATGSNDTSLDGGADEDTLNISDANNLTMTDVNFTDVSNFEKLVLAADGNVSMTVGTNFGSAFGSAASITAASIGADHSFTYSGGLYNGATTLAVTTLTDGDGAATAEDYNITTGDGDDTVTLTASSFVSDGDGHGSVSISTDAGADTISLTIGTIVDNATAQVVTIDAGAGADTVTLVKVNGAGTGSEKANAIFIVENGDSTLAARDTIKGVDEADGTDMADTIDFTGSAAVTDFSSSTNAGVIKSHSVSTGMVTFDDVENFDTALVIDADNLSDVLDYLVANTASLDTAAFAYDSDGDGSADATMIYHNNDVDSLIELSANTGITALTTSLTVTDGQLQII